METHERRQHQRAGFPGIRLRLPSGPGFDDELLSDLSAGGVFLLTRHTLPVGSELDIELIDRSGEPLRFCGRVTRIQFGAPDAGADRNHGMAIEFVDPPPALAEAVERMVGHQPATVERSPEPESPKSGPGGPHLDTGGRAEGIEQERRAESVRSRVEKEELEGRVLALSSELRSTRDELARARVRVEELERILGGPAARADPATAPSPLRPPNPQSSETAHGRRSPPLDVPRIGVAVGFPWPTEPELPGELEVASVGAPLAPSPSPPSSPPSPASPARSGGAASAMPRELTKPTTVGPETVASFGEFVRLLEQGAALTTTERFERLEPVSRGDIQVSDWLREAGDLEAIRTLAKGRMTEAELRRVLHLFFQRDLVRIGA